MGHKNREIEVKLLVNDIKTLSSVACQIEKVWHAMDKHSEADASEDYDNEILVGNASDFYWNAPKGCNADFGRLRKRSGGGAQLTIKSTDRGDNVNRVEVDVDVDDHGQAYEFMTGLLGEPTAKVTKKYSVFFLENQHTNISVYQIRGDDRVFVEVEAKTLKRVIQILNTVIDSTNYEYSWIKSSVYQMFVQKKQMVVKSVNDFLLKGSNQ